MSTNNDMVTIQMDLPREALDVAEGFVQTLAAAIADAKGQVDVQNQGLPGSSEMTPDQQAMQAEIDGMSQLRG